MKKENMNDLNKKLGFDVNEMKNAAQKWTALQIKKHHLDFTDFFA